MKDSQSAKWTKSKKAEKPKEKSPKTVVFWDHDIWFTLPLIGLLFILLMLMLYNITLKQQISQSAIPSLKSTEHTEYPIVHAAYLPDISAESAVIIDDTSKVVVYQKNPHLRFSMASTTKIMTALVGLEHYKLDDTLTTKTATVEGSAVGFRLGEQITFENALYGMLLPSGNDAALMIAQNYPGGFAAFIQAMNNKAMQLGLKYTHYVDPAGLDDDGNYTTVTDLARLASYALKNKQFALVVSTKKIILTDISGNRVYPVENLNKLLGEKGVTGIKTGFTEGAGEVLVTSKVEKGHIFLIVVMKSTDRFADTQKLLTILSNNVTFVDPVR